MNKLFKSKELDNLERSKKISEFVNKLIEVIDEKFHPDDFSIILKMTAKRKESAMVRQITIAKHELNKLETEYKKLKNE